jgi:hypothetical protein
MKKAELNASLTGFVIALILIAMFGTMFSLIMTDMKDEYDVSGNNTFTKYANYTSRLNRTVQDIRNSTDIEQDTGFVDIIGGYFSAGYGALRTAALSFNMFGDMMNDASEDVPEFSFFRTYIWMIIAIIIFIGIVLTVLVKMRI